MKEYEVKVTYEGYILLEASSPEDAIAKARETWAEETTRETAHYSEYEIEDGE